MPAVPTPTSSAEPSAAALRDADLVQRLAGGDLQGAFEGILQRYERKVLHLCHAMLRDRHQAEEAAQDSFLRVWRALPRYAAERAALSTWIFTIARNRCLSLLEASGLDLHSDEASWAEAEQVAAVAPVSDAAAQALLQGLIDALPTAQRSCLTLYYFEELAVAEVAQMLGLPEGTVKTHLHRARAALYRGLEQHGLAQAALWY